ncbi:unnamed protein product [Fusarium graminearum]|nr:unnamed protein product [Fusarium graminearum]
MDPQAPHRHNTIYVNSSALGPPCCQSLGISLVAEVRSHGQTKMALIDCREQLGLAHATTAALETRNNQLAAENLRLTLALAHIAPWAHVQASRSAETNSENLKDIIGDGASKAQEDQGERHSESGDEFKN